MATILFKEIVFGPVRSRRLGISLGINLLPFGHKVCNFNCVYCECGLTRKFENKYKTDIFPFKEEVKLALEEKLQSLSKLNYHIDNITFAGNGEPTLHPDFPEIVNLVLELRNKFYPETKVSVLTNASTLDNQNIVKALKKTDSPIIKLDAGNEETMKKINCPITNIHYDKLIENIKNFGKPLIIQSLFLRGEINGKIIDNTNEKELLQWKDKIVEISPDFVMIYTIARDTPYSNIERISEDELKNIAELLNKEGIKTGVYY